MIQMIKITNIPFIRQPRRASVRQAGPPLTVGAAFTADPPAPGEVFYAFDGGEVTLTGVPIGLRAFVGGVWIEPESAMQEDPFTLRVQYDTVESMDAKLYSIVTTPSGIVQAADIVLPEEGTIHAP